MRRQSLLTPQSTLRTFLLKLLLKKIPLGMLLSIQHDLFWETSNPQCPNPRMRSISPPCFFRGIRRAIWNTHTHARTNTCIHTRAHMLNQAPGLATDPRLVKLNHKHAGVHKSSTLAWPSREFLLGTESGTIYSQSFSDLGTKGFGFHSTSVSFLGFPGGHRAQEPG